MPFMFNSLFVREDGPFNLLGGSVLNNMVMLYGLHLHLDETSSWPIRPHSDHSSFSMQLHLASTCVFFSLSRYRSHVNARFKCKQSFRLLAGHWSWPIPHLYKISILFTVHQFPLYKQASSCVDQMGLIRIEYEYIKDKTWLFCQFDSYIHLIIHLTAPCHTIWQ